MMKAKTACKAAGLILAFSVLFACAGCTVDPTEEQDGADLVTADEAIVIDGDGNALLTDGTVQQMPKQMIFSLSEVQEAESEAEISEISEYSSEASVTVTATITPSYAADKSVDWSVAFADGTTSTDATDFVTVTPESDGSLTATITCLKAFSKQILVTVTSRSNPDVSGSCEVDYLQRASGYSMTFGEYVLTYSESAASVSGFNAVIGLLDDDGATSADVHLYYAYGGTGSITQTFTATVQFVGNSNFMKSSFAFDNTFTYTYWIELPTVTLTSGMTFSFGQTYLESQGATLHYMISGSTLKTEEALSTITSSIASKMWSGSATPRVMGTIVVTVSGDKDEQYGLSAKTWSTSVFASSYV